MMKSGSNFPWHLPPLLLPICVVLGLMILDPAFLQLLRDGAFDQYQRWRPRIYQSQPVRIIDIDETSLARLGQWPWPRTRLAELVGKLGAGGAAAIVFDVMFVEPDRDSPPYLARREDFPPALRSALAELPDTDEQFATVIRPLPVALGFALTAGTPGAPPVTQARFVSAGPAAVEHLHAFDAALKSLDGLAHAAAGHGAISFVADADGIVRRVPLALRMGATPLPSLVAEALRLAEKTSTIVLKTGPAGALEEGRIGRHAIPLTASGEFWVHYAPPVPERTIPAWRVLAADWPATRLDGQIFFVGSSALGLLDMRFSPLGALPGVEVHAQGVEQILGGQFLLRPAWARGLEAVVMVLASLGVGLFALRRPALPAALAGGVVLALLGAASWLAFSLGGVLLDGLLPALGVVLTFTMCSLAHHLASEKQQRWLKVAFARYVSPNRVNYLLAHPEAMELGGRRQECSFIFTDLEGFTGLIELIPPRRAVTLLNEYLDGLLEIVFRHEGTLDRIVGDALVVMFSAPLRQPDHRRRVLACALEMDAFACRYAARQQARGVALGRTRIGVHAGAVTVGNFGGGTMFDYRALGDPVNIAARLESVNKQLGTRVCISDTIHQANPEVAVRPVGRLVLKGKTQALLVHEPLIGEQASGQAPAAAYLAAYAELNTAPDAACADFAALAQAYPQDSLVAFHARRLAAGEQGDVIVLREK